MEIGILARDPLQEAADPRVGPDRAHAVTKDAKLRVGKGSVQRSVADWVDGHRLAPAAALRHWVMELGRATKRPTAQPAVRSLDIRHQVAA